MNKDIFVITEHLQGRVLEISYVMLAAARTLAEASGGQVVAVLLGHNVQALADDFNADRLLYLDHPA
ncbi:MAG TPA: electron transfer flavoprotein subunit alpha/FixB family protein, partial [Caldilineae bacterium]|nr:electron transfer flavoprotein subunit alpha/FixB family protein [Caldilineae bacterium]